jgi:hypothetical protein
MGQRLQRLKTADRITVVSVKTVYRHSVVDGRLTCLRAERRKCRPMECRNRRPEAHSESAKGVRDMEFETDGRLSALLNIPRAQCLHARALESEIRVPS